MKYRGLYYPKKKISISIKSTIFFVILFSFYTFFSLANNVTTIVLNKEPVDVFKQNLKWFALYSRTIDNELGQFILTIDDIIQEYNQGENAFITKKKQIDQARKYIIDNNHRLENRGFDRYQKLFALLTELYPHKEEIYTLLGEEKAMNYLAILQNTAEKRPNGGFFGSFAFANIKNAKVNELGIVDTYFPNYIAPDTLIQAPARSETYLSDTNIGFVAANKFGFTDIDGENIKILFEKIFNEDYNLETREQSAYSELQKTLLHKYIKGVIFLRTDTFEEILPSFSEKIRERQFVNASIDLIRGEVRSHKKEIYLEEVNKYFFQNQYQIIKAVINNFTDISNEHAINIYLSNTSSELTNILKKYGLTTHYDPTHIYLRDTNNAFNKIGRFITKEVIIKKNNNIVSHHYNQDIINIKNLEPGIHTIHILYHLNIDPEYIKFIKTLEKKYEIELTQREIGILGLGKSVNDTMRGTNAIVHFPEKRTINQPGGNVIDTDTLFTPFSKAAIYSSEIRENNQTNIITIKVQVPDQNT